MMRMNNTVRKVSFAEEAAVGRKKAPQAEKKVGVGKAAAEGSRGFRMPLHYPRYRREEYEEMEEWKVDMVLGEYGLSYDGTLHEKRSFAIGAFLWPNQL